MAYHKNDFIKRIQAVEALQKKYKKKVYIYKIYADFAGPQAMEREFKKSKYHGCVIILNDLHR